MLPFINNSYLSSALINKDDPLINKKQLYSSTFISRLFIFTILL